MTTTPRRKSPPVVAIINSSPDTIDMLQVVLEQAGMQVFSAYTFDMRDGRTDVDAFMRAHRPEVIVYDIAPPYDANVELFRQLRSTPLMRHKQFVITSTNGSYVQKLIGRDEHVYEVIGKPFDLDLIVQATKEALRSRPTR